MPGSFLDTTIVIEIADKGVDVVSATAHVSAHQPSVTPYYALRELLAGHVQILCDAHNVISASENPAQALLSLLRRSPLEGRKKGAKLQALADALNKAFTANPSGDRDRIKKEMLEAMALRVTQIWLRSRKINNVKLVQQLACFNDGKISYGSSQELRGPRDSFNCIKASRCAAAAYLYDDKNNLSKMIEALHPRKITAALAKKNETTRRREALKELAVKGPQDFDKSKCRALGDAYFAAMCPPGSQVVTTNISDFEPLCAALAKQVVKPA